MKDVNLYCVCGLKNHHVNIENDDEQVCISFPLNPYLSFFKRLKVGIKYILGLSTSNDNSFYDTVHIYKSSKEYSDLKCILENES